ncbi:MAG: carboxypeptidase regulatory-like domain-containing protein [Bryobacteraceae bacterium]
MTRTPVFLAAVAALSSSLYAQDPRGFIRGTITDPSGAAIPGAHVRATAADTGVAASAETNESGLYNIPYLIPGFYTLSVEQTGFKTFVRQKVEVRVSETTEIPIVLEVGQLSERIEVTDTAPPLETASASLGLVMDQRRISELPQRGGNPLELTLLAPGVANTTNLRLRKSMAPEATSDFSADGAGRYTNEFQIDGISNTAADRGRGYARVAYAPPASSVREFKMQTSAYDASIGHTMGTIVNVSTASGTNELHGEGHWFLRHSSLDAPNFFNNKNNTTKGVYQDNRWGASLGGPINIPKLYNGHNRSFFFFAYEGNTFGVPTQFTRTVPTAEQRLGDFSSLLPLSNANYAIYDPQSTTAAAGGRFSRTPFAGNIIPRSRLDQVGLNLASLYPLPTSNGTSDFRNNYFSSPKAIQKTYSTLLRLDHAVNENHRLFLRVHYDFWKENKNHDFLNEINGIHQNRPNRGAALDDVLVLSPTTVLNLRYGFTSTKWWQYRVSRGIDYAALGFSPRLIALTDKGQAPLPRVTPGAYSALSHWEDPGDGVNSSLTHSAQASFTILKSSHTLRFGPEFRAYRSFNNRRPIGNAPDYSFTNTYTRGPLDNSPAAPIGQDLAAMLLGIPAGSMEVASSSALQNQYLALFLQDDWKLSRRFTLNYGVRYELETPITERYNRLQAGFDSTTANPIEAQARANYARNPIPELPADQFRVQGGLTWVDQNGVGRSPYIGEKNNVMPRLGFAFEANPKTVVRGGYGIFFNTLGVNTILPLQTGFSQSTPIQASLDSGITYVATTANPFPSGLIPPAGSSGGLATNLGQSLNTYFRPNKQGYAQRWSLGVQRMLPGQVVLDTSYVANRGTRLDVSREFNATPAEYLSRSPQRDQTTIDFLSRTFPSPFRGTNPIYGANISRGNLLRPYPQFGNIQIEVPTGYSWYHSLQMRAERRFLNGFTFQLAYTWAKTMEATEFLNAADTVPYESISSFDRPHRIASTGIWEVPIGKGRRFANALPAQANFILGGWQIGAVVALQSGGPMGFGNAIFNGDIDNIALSGGQRDVDRWFNTDAGFNRNASQQLASNYRQFPLRFGGIRSPGQKSWDFSLVKNFPIHERVRAQFRADAYNAWNHTNLNAPNTAPTNTAFGRITSTAGDSRNWQMSLKMIF